MTRDEKAQALYDFCDNKTFNCTDCPLSKKYDKKPMNIQILMLVYLMK